MTPITVGFYDEKQLLRALMQHVYSTAGELNIRFSAWNEESLLESLQHSVPDIVLMNLSGKPHFCQALMLKLKNEFPFLKIIGYVYGAELSQEEVFRIINAGASSILTDEHTPEEVLRAFQQVMENGFHMNEVVNEAMFMYCKRNRVLRKSFGPGEKFSEREIKIIEQKKSGKTSVEIAGELFISRKTVDGILHELYSRHECRNFNELLRKYESMNEMFIVKS
ncbi:MAG: LuxR C-terminal-related transcriptional regulator [Bacteroidetes bacterium]|nr:LuxR C-terminal-related transcriptional regulator [Bacteroidota bacterium]